MQNLEAHFYCPKCRSCPNQGVPIKESLPQVSRLTKVPLLVIQDLQQNGIIHTPLVCGDVIFLHRYSLVRETYGGHFEPPRKRRRRLEHWSLKEDFQKWIYAHYINDLSGQRIYVDNVIWEVSANCIIPEGVDLKDEIERIRQIVYNDRRRARQSRRPVEEVAKERFSQLEIEFESD